MPWWNNFENKSKKPHSCAFVRNFYRCFSLGVAKSVRKICDSFFDWNVNWNCQLSNCFQAAKMLQAIPYLLLFFLWRVNELVFGRANEMLAPCVRSFDMPTICRFQLKPLNGFRLLFHMRSKACARILQNALNELKSIVLEYCSVHSR